MSSPQLDPAKTGTPDPSRRVVITGRGVVSPLGNDPAELVQVLREGKSGIRELTSVPGNALNVTHGGEAISFTGAIDDYGPMEKKLQRTIKKSSKVMCREIEMGVAVAQLALVDANLSSSQINPDRVGVVYGCDYIMSLPQEFAAAVEKCVTDGTFDFSVWGEQGKPQVNPLWLLKYLPNMPASHIAIFNDLRGPNNSITVREASAGAALAEAYSMIVRGHADALIVGSTGSRIHPLRTLHSVMQEPLSGPQDDHESMSRPFDESRSGSVVGEGAGALVLETLEHAKARDANILAELTGYGTSAVGPKQQTQAGEEPVDETFLQTAVENVLRSAIRGSDPSRVGHINAHGLSTVQCDQQEAKAIASVFGESASQPPVTTAKGHFGNLGAGGGMVEIIASLDSLGAELFPIRNLNALDSNCPINAVVESGTDAGDSFVSVNVTPQGQASAVMIDSYSS
ncbi:MAG: beta-ketoacyl synthase N-terminal-like domain-containing protein [Planctomycetota bacterium]